jgi:hypothetical protein
LPKIPSEPCGTCRYLLVGLLCLCSSCPFRTVYRVGATRYRNRTTIRGEMKHSRGIDSWQIPPQSLTPQGLQRNEKQSQKKLRNSHRLQPKNTNSLGLFT